MDSVSKRSRNCAYGQLQHYAGWLGKREMSEEQLKVIGTAQPRCRMDRRARGGTKSSGAPSANVVTGFFLGVMAREGSKETKDVVRTPSVQQ